MIIKPQTKQAAELQNTVPMDTSTIDSGITGEVKAERLEDPENYKFYCETFFLGMSEDTLKSSLQSDCLNTSLIMTRTKT